MHFTRHSKLISRLLKKCLLPKQYFRPDIRILDSISSKDGRITKRFTTDSGCSFPLIMDVKCKVAIITGGETGIGLAAANSLLTNGAKMVVLAGVCDGAAAIKQLTEDHGEGRVCYMNMDVNAPREFEELFFRVDSVFSSVDIVFNNAGILADHAWENQVDTNLKSVLRGTLLGLDYMGRQGRGKRKGGGVIINHSDVAALDGFPFAPCYVATKAGIIGATLSFGSKELYKESDVRVVGLVSGPTDTALLRDITEKMLTPAWGKAAAEAFSQAPPQNASYVGSAVTHLVQYAPSGTLWTVEHGELSLTTMPHRHTFSTKITQL